MTLLMMTAKDFVYPEPNHPDYIDARLGFIRVGDVYVDPSYQRSIKERWRDVLAATYDVRKASAVEVAVIEWTPERPFHFAAINGQHRCGGAMKKFGPDFRLPALIWSDMTLAQQAETFVAQTDSRQLTGPEVYKAALTSGVDNNVMAVKAILDSRELSVHDSGGPSTIRGAKGLVRAYSKFGETALERALDTLVAVYGRKTTTWQSAAISGVTEFFAAYPAARDERVIKQLKDQPYTDARGLILAATAHTSGGGSESRPRLVAKLTQQLYDKGLPASSRLVPEAL